MLPILFLDALRVAVLLGGTLLLLALLRRVAASVRRLLLALAFTGALLLPLIAALIPSFPVRGAELAVPAMARVLDPLVDEAADPVRVTGAAPTSLAPSPTKARQVGFGHVAAIVWLGGALLVLGRLVLGLAAARRVARAATPVCSTRWADDIERARRITGLRADVRESDAIDAPAVTGLFSSVVLVPLGSDSWTDERRLAVLLHELAHVEQRDCLVYALATLTCALHWFDPLAWLALRSLRLERELAADDAVLRGGARPSTYAADLLSLAGETGLHRAAPIGALGMAARPQLVTRIEAIVSPLRSRGSLTASRAVWATLGAAATVSTLACVTPHTDREPAAHVATPTAGPVALSSGAWASQDREIQSIAEEELERVMREWQPAAGTVLVLDPTTGEVLANAGRTSRGPSDVALRTGYVTGSTLKTMTLVAALDEGVVTPTDSFDCGQGTRAYGTTVLHDAGSYGTLPLPEAFAVSSNVGFSRVFDRLGGARLGSWLRRFHLGAAPPVEGAAAGTIPASIEDGSFAGAVVAIGETVVATPLQMASAYAAVANGGAYVAPTLSRRSAADAPREMLMKASTARAVTSMLEGVVTGERATGKQARIEGVRVAGKTGTASWGAESDNESYASFIGFFPAEQPRFVVLVGVEAPRGGESGGKVAAPAFARVGAKILAARPSR